MKLQELAREAQLSWRLATQGFRPKPKRVGWLVGSGRSGTTWISSLLNADASMREVFEPIHVLHSPLMSKGPEHPYFRPDQVPRAWRKWQQDVFEGRYITRRTDQDNLGRNPANAGKLLIKDVFACGMVAANLANLSAVAPALIMRHPIAVALSKKAHKHWFWTWSPEVFLGQSEWVEDHLFRHKDFLTRTAKEGSVLEKLVAVWAVLQATTLRSAPATALPILHYESTVIDPWLSVKSLSKHPSWEGMLTASEEQVLAAAQRASFVSKSADASRFPDPTNWTSKVTPAERRACERVLDEMGMAGWHDAQGLPVSEAIQDWRDAQRPPLA